MNQLAIVYHSAHGHTEHLAHHVQRGAQEVDAVHVHLLQAQDLQSTPEVLIGYDGIIFGSPTYLGGVSGPFKSFMDATGRLWRAQHLKGKLAAGFTVSSLPAGDKQSTLISMFTFSMQHGMLWVGSTYPDRPNGTTNSRRSWLREPASLRNRNGTFASAVIASSMACKARSATSKSSTYSARSSRYWYRRWRSAFASGSTTTLNVMQQSDDACLAVRVAFSQDAPASVPQPLLLERPRQSVGTAPRRHRREHRTQLAYADDPPPGGRSIPRNRTGFRLRAELIRGQPEAVAPHALAAGWRSSCRKCVSNVLHGQADRELKAQRHSQRQSSPHKGVKGNTDIVLIQKAMHHQAAGMHASGQLGLADLLSLHGLCKLPRETRFTAAAVASSGMPSSLFEEVVEIAADGGSSDFPDERREPDVEVATFADAIASARRLVDCQFSVKTGG